MGVLCRLLLLSKVLMFWILLFDVIYNGSRRPFNPRAELKSAEAVGRDHDGNSTMTLPLFKILVFPLKTDDFNDRGSIEALRPRLRSASFSMTGLQLALRPAKIRRPTSPDGGTGV